MHDAEGYDANLGDDSPSDVAPVSDHDQNSHGKVIAILFYVFCGDQIY
jgi:hypothetical protein